MIPQRLISLDVFRGIAIAGMILVNSPGGNTAYAFLNHSVWNGCTFADLVFPFFLFIVGAALVYSLTRQVECGVNTTEILLKIFKRAALIFLVGVLLNFPHSDWSTLRILGVLQRIAICYAVSACLFLFTSTRTQAWIFISLLIGYWLVMTFIPSTEFGAGNLTKEGNLAAVIDRFLLGSHTYTPVYDPEGFLSTVPAIATTLLGNLTGIWLISSRTKSYKFRGMITAGLLFALLGYIWGFWFPINKALWTSSFVLWTGGIALIVLAICYWLIDIRQWQKWSKPLEIFGTNALAVYILHIVFLKIQYRIPITGADGVVLNLRLYLTEHVFGWATPNAASLMYAISYALLWLVVLTWMYRRKIFLRF